MEKRYSSPSSSPRPRAFRKRSNSFPISEALGCSTPEAELILAEGRAAVRTRLANRQRVRRREGTETFRPKDHIGYLSQQLAVPVADHGASTTPPASRAFRHSRIPSDASNATDRSTSTIIAPSQSSEEAPPRSPILSASPLEDYSAHLAQFIQSQLNSIPTYRVGTTISPRSCPDLPSSRSRPQSPIKPMTAPMRRHLEAPNSIVIPGIRPPARSAFSEWSSTDDDTDDEAPALPSTSASCTLRKTEAYTPSLLGYYEQPNDSTFLFPSTPDEEEDDPDTAKANSFPNNSELPGMPDGAGAATQDDDYPSSAFSRLSLVTSSSAPSISSISTGSYFEFKTGISQPADKAVEKVVPAISPFEGAALANVHDILVQSQQRILVDGMSFDMIRDFSMPVEGSRRIQTPC